MMSAIAYSAPYAAFPQYASTDAALEDWSRHLAASQVARRPSRSSNGPRPGNAMRITKPTSTSSSPRSSILQARRRTLVSDGNPSRKRQHIMDQVALPVPAMGLATEPTKRNQRPVSWHPASSHFQAYEPQAQALPQTQLHQQHQQPTAGNVYHLPSQGRWNDQNLFASYQHMSPMASSYSCQASPVTFSPLSLPANDFNSQPCFPADNQGWALPAQLMPGYVSPPVDNYNISPAMESNVDYTGSSTPLFPPTHSISATSNSATNGMQASGMTDWRAFVEHGFDRTFPPTPENLPQMQQLKPAVKSDGSTPYEPLSEPEDDSEILVGMGLYDTPDKYEADPGLNNYRSTLSSLLGGGAPKLPEPAGKGLKLEETWQPPETDDEDEDEDETDEKEQDGEDA